MNRPYLFIGDSLVEYFDWQKRFPGSRIYNLGIAGETAEGLLARLPSVLSRAESPAMVMVMTGANNLVMEDYSFLFTYEKIISRLQEPNNETLIVVAGLLPMDLYFLGDAVKRVNRRLQDLARRSKAAFLDLFPLYVDRNDRNISSLFEADGVHLNRAGYEVWARALETEIFPLLHDSSVKSPLRT